MKGGYNMLTTYIKLYWLPALLIVIGILFIIRWYFYAKGYKNKYTIEVTAKVVERKRTAFPVPLIVYEADVNGTTERLVELPPIGAPWMALPPGYEVKLFIHPDPEIRKKVLFTEETRPFVNELAVPFNNLFFKLMGIGFLLTGRLMIFLFTNK